MKYNIIGSGSCVPNSNRNSSGAILEAGGKIILVDCGTGILHNIPQTKYDYTSIDIVCITHLHLDHINDFGALLFAYRNDPECNRMKDLQIIGPVGFKNYYKCLKKMYGDTIKPKNYKITISESEHSSYDINNIKIKTYKTYHTEESIGFRFEYEDRILAVSGDTGYQENIIELSKRASLAIMECSFPDKYNFDYHLTPSTAGKIAEKAGVKRLILTHLYPVAEKHQLIKQCKKHFSGKVEIAKNYKPYIVTSSRDDRIYP